MKQKIKEFSKKYLVGFIIGSILFGTLGVYAVTYFPGLNTTYDNSDSGMTSTNVQDALDELYNVCVPSASDQIIEDGNLTKDEYECRYFFTGGDPNNYITFNNETAGWRIISVECDGTIKIMRITDIAPGSLVWDSSNSNNWARPASLNTYLNSTYYNSLNANAQSKIVAKSFSIGAIIYNNNGLEYQINAENSNVWKGKIALPTLSEFLRTNSNKSGCGTFALYNDNYSNCRNTMWMYNRGYWWTLTPYSGNSAHVFAATNGAIGYNVASHTYDNGLSGVRPALYLSSEVKITGGDGSQSNPYTLSEI